MLRKSAMPVTITFDPDRVFIFIEGAQQGPFNIRTAEALWKQTNYTKDTWLWSPGMKDWTPIGDLLDSALPPAPKVKKDKVLAVDDDPVMLQMVKYILEEEGYEVSTAEDMLPACELLEQKELDYFDCVVTDYTMPGGTGLDLVRWMKQFNESLQVLLLTAQDDKQLIKSGLRAGIFDFLEKPLKQDILISSVQRGIEITKKRREERQALMEVIKMRLSGHGMLAEEVIEKIVARESNSTSLLSKLDHIIQYSRKLEDSSATASGIKGKLGDVSLLDIIQLLAQAGKCGRLSMYPHPSEMLADPCEVYFSKGKFYHVISGDQTGIPALRQLLQCRQGGFAFDHDILNEAESISGDPIALMLMISTEIDEAQHEPMKH